MSGKKNQQQFKTTIGGQAVIEGIMMRGPSQSSLAVRAADGEIRVETFPTASGSVWYKKTPFIRGIFNFVDTMRLGYKTLMRSAELSGMEEDGEQLSAFEQKLQKLLGDKFFTALTGLAGVLGAALAVLLFILVPSALVRPLGAFIGSGVVLALLEGVIKIAIFIAYLALVSKMKDIRRVFEYHGAEHKTIFCYEDGQELTVENIKKHSRFHPRCGTSFLLIVLVVSIVFFAFISWGSVIIRVLLKLLLLPAVVCVAYEIIRFCGRYDNAVTRIISAPGMWMQRFTTFEPDDSQIEVAIAAMSAVIPEKKGEDEW